MPKSKLEVVKEPKASEAQFVLCNRVKDMPIPYHPAKIMLCEECGERVWLSNDTPQGIPVLCMQCGVARIKAEGEEPTIMITEQQLENVAKYVREAEKGRK